jgi:hypothetical protein
MSISRFSGANLDMKRVVHLSVLALSSPVAVAQPIAFTDVTVIKVADGLAEPGRTVAGPESIASYKPKSYLASFKGGNSLHG